jgi:hypothetical protein
MPTRKRQRVEMIYDIQPEQIYRTNRSEELFGFGPQVTAEKIKKHELPTPFPLSASSIFKAWTGQQILDHRAAMRKLADQKAEADKLRSKQEQPLALRGKVKKQKLRKPAPATS